MRTPKAPRQWNSTIKVRDKPIKRGAKPIAIGKGAKGRQDRFKKFLGSATWKAQKKRVHERDGWQCTEGPVEVYSCNRFILIDRCQYTKEDGPLHADHDSYGHRGLENVPDEKIHTKCPYHHMKKDGAKALRAMAIQQRGKV